MRERMGQLKEHTLKHIAKQRKVELSDVEFWAALLSEEGLPKAEIYRRLTNSYGIRKSYESDKKDGEVRDGGKRRAFGRSRRRER